MKRISIIIATYNRADLLAETLESLAAHLQDARGCEVADVIVVNNNSSDATAEVATGFGARIQALKVVLETNQGLSYARNRGIEEATGDLIVFLDDDVDLGPDWLLRLVQPFADDEKVAATGSRVLPHGTGALPDWLPRQYAYLASVFDPADRQCEVESVMGASFAIRKADAQRFGMFNVALGRKGGKLLGGEEIELFKKLRDAGMKVVFVPESVVFHKIQSKLNRDYIRDYAYWLGVSEALIDRKLYGRAKHFLKCVRSVFFPRTVYALKRMNDHSEAAEMLFVIRRQYARGYLNSQTEMQALNG